jgi:hypothetical protein
MGHVGLTRASGAGARPRGRARAAPRALVPRVPAVSLALDPRRAPRPPRVADEARVRRVHADLGGRAPQTATRGQPSTPGARAVVPARRPMASGPRGAPQGLASPVGVGARSGPGRRGPGPRGGLGSAARASAPERPNPGQPTGGLSRLARRRMHPGPRPHPGSPLTPASAPDTAFRPTN